jgi:hypothetical protein
MRPEREFLLQQATACRQLALISAKEDAARLRKLAEEYDALALPDPGIIRQVAAGSSTPA